MIKTLRLLTNFISLALFGTKHFRSDVRFFLKSEFRKNAVSSLNGHNSPISIQLPAGVLFLFIFFYWLFTVCKLPVLDNKIWSNNDYQRMGCICDNHLSLMGSLVFWLRIFERWKKLRAVTCVKVSAYTRLHLKNVQIKCRLIAAYHTETYLKHIMINIKCIIKSSMWLTGS